MKRLFQATFHFPLEYGKFTYLSFAFTNWDDVYVNREKNQK